MEASYPRRVIAIFGPTASGKTDVAEALADRMGGELVSADAMQVYRGLPILTNQSPRPARLVAIWPLSYEASVAEYQRLAHEAIDELLAAGRTPIVVGGTGLYLRAALAGLHLPPAPPPALRARLDRAYERLGPDRAHALLAARDPAAATRIHPNDRRRVVRALELAEVGRSLAPAEERLWAADARHPTLLVGLDVPQDVLARRIEERTRRMLERGVEDEVRRALAEPISPTARAIHGLSDFAELPRDQAIEAYNRRVRRYAAYQRKWMRRIPGLVPVDASRPVAEIVAEILALNGELVVRPARSDEVDALFELHRSSALAAYAHVFPPDRYPFPDTEVRERWRTRLAADETQILVAEREGELLGLVAVSRCRLEALYVRPDVWGAGVGSRLHDEALAALAAAGCREARLWVLDANDTARRFYERRRWRLDGGVAIGPSPPHAREVSYTRTLDG